MKRGITSGIPSVLFRSMSRDGFFAGLFILYCANGLGSRVIASINSVGWADAVLSTFDVSAIVWISCIGGVGLIVGERSDDEIRRLDLIVGGVLLIPVALPIGALSWLAVTIFSLYVIYLTCAPSSRRRGAMILLAVTVPMLWSPLVFRYFANFILQVDASLVSVLLGTPRSDNLVRFADGSGSLLVLPYCSSLHNVSLTILSWVAINQWLARRPSASDWQWIIVASVAVVTINVTRMSLMGLSLKHYQAIHGFWGQTITNLLVLCAIVGICWLGVRRESFSRA
jgi:hypothetical protein